jgi:hypothetical protein
MSNHRIDVQDSVQAQDKLSTWKKWFNGAKHFFTVKSLPPSPTRDIREGWERDTAKPTERLKPPKQ